MIHPLEYSYTQFHIKYHPAWVSFSNLLKILSIRWRFSRHPQYCPMPHGFWITDSRHPQLVCNSLWSPQDLYCTTLIQLIPTIIPTDILRRFFLNFLIFNNLLLQFIQFHSIIKNFKLFLQIFQISNQSERQSSVDSKFRKFARKFLDSQVAKAAYGPSERVYMCTQSSMIHPVSYQISPCLNFIF